MTVHHPVLLLALALALLAGCTRRGPPAPVEMRGISGTAAPARSALAPNAGATPSAAVQAGAGGHQVGRGETLYGVARQYDVPVRAIIDANGLQPPYQLLIGQRLAIPQQRTHLIVQGDTVYSISRRYGADMSELVRLNHVEPPYAIKTGEKLLLPSPVMIAGAAPAPIAALAPPPVAASPLAAGAAAAPATGVSVAVTPLAPPLPGLAAPPRETAIAAAPAPVRPAPRDSAETPRSSEEDGRAALAPPVAPPPVAAPLDLAPAANPVEPPPAVAEPATPLPSVPAPSAPRTQQAVIKEPPPPPPRGARTFLWPLRGRVLTTYGERGGGLHNDGINIAAARGTPVRAAENGVVAYAGSEIKAFGNLLLIRHADGFMTAYAHNETLLVQLGDVVRRGQTIARVGSSGNVGQPQLHFEVRKGTQAIDPESVLGNPAAASAEKYPLPSGEGGTQRAALGG